MSKRAYKYRFYPTDEQKHQLACTFGCVRYVYNWALHARTRAYFDRGEKLYYNDLSALLPVLKKEFPWLGDISSVPLQQALRHLDKAFINFFEGRAKSPKYHKKHQKQSATYTASAFTWNRERLTLAKMKEPLQIVWSRSLPDGAKPSSVTVTRDKADRYFVSILVEEEIKPLPVSRSMVGIDLGLKHLLITSEGEKVDNPKYYARTEKKLAKAQRCHARKKKGSKNRNKARKKVARLHAKIADQRRNLQHQVSTRLIRENQVISLETLAVKNMLQNHTLAKAISDVGWSELVRQLEYKAAWYGRTVVRIDRFTPSSKTCSDCSHVLEELALDVRSWVCPCCGVVHDRDINAAKNILAAGLVATACGGAVRPVRAKVRRARANEAGNTRS